MSVRIYQLSKEIGVDNIELIQILRSRGHDVKSASSTVDNISADSLRAEYAQAAKDKQDKAQASPTPAAPVAVPVEAPQPPVAAPVVEAAKVETPVVPEPPTAKPVVVAPPQPVRPAGAPPLVPPPVPSGKAPPLPPRAIPGRVPPPVVQVRPGSRYSGPPSREVVQPPQPQSQAQAAQAPVVSPANVVRAPVPPQANRAPEATAPARVAPPVPQMTARAPAVPVSTPPPAPAMPVVNRAPMPPSRAVPVAPAPLSAPAIPPRAPMPVAAPSSPLPPPRAIAATAAATAESTVKSDAAHGKKRVLTIKPPIVVRDFAIQIGLKPFQLISELMEMNIFASMNQVIEPDVARRIADRHSIELDVKHRGETPPAPVQEKKVAAPVQKVKLDPRPPVVCILGHVDHGKTTLLDTIRKTQVAAGEAGGITQHIGAYQVDHKSRKITFIDTPGHAAFSNMRARGANVTDIAVLVVAADDGFMPQTDEALGHARQAGVPIVVAINKTDMPGADVEKVRRQLQERNLTPEEWGGETLAVPVSALKGNGIPELLDAIILQTEVTEGIEADYKAKPTGVILETQKEVGIGSTSSVIIEAGTLKRGDALVCGQHYCRVRTLIDDHGKQLKEATPGMPVKIVGWSGTPDAGDSFHAVANERAAKEEAEENAHRMKLDQIHADEANQPSGKASLDDLFAAIEQAKAKTFRVVVKADVFGTAEALAVCLQQIKSEKIKLEVVDMGVGSISQNDILMASASQAAIVAFDVNLENGVASFAKHHSIRLFQHNIIYELIDQVKDAMRDELPPELRENKIGAAEIRQLFPVSKGIVAGSMVTEGRIARSALSRLMRKGQVVAEGRISTLRRFKDDASEVRAGYECGIQMDNCNSYQIGDTIECYEILKIKAAL